MVGQWTIEVSMENNVEPNAKLLDNVIPLFVEKPMREKIAFNAKCSFCLKEAKPGEYINDGNSKSPVICFSCVKLAAKRLAEEDAKEGKPQ